VDQYPFNWKASAHLAAGWAAGPLAKNFEQGQAVQSSDLAAMNTVGFEFRRMGAVALSLRNQTSTDKRFLAAQDTITTSERLCEHSANTSKLIC
jgi:hypothetical protein